MIQISSISTLSHIRQKEMEIIRDRLETEVNSLEELTKIATNTLSEMTHYTAITISPDLENHNIIESVIVVGMGSETQTEYLQNTPIATQNFTLTDANYSGLPISDATLNFEENQ